MARTRALLTETEREYIAGEGNPTDSQRYQAISRVRERIRDELPKDIELLAEHHPELLKELREETCSTQNG
ncbi:hypothetical protein [Haladaptatus sp. DFWS20]|uniref:hypothetical protein n=1 Tax=Haladaptatus sp. DFWS20 TaxID=3403467 RepID=UPI003EB936A8